MRGRCDSPHSGRASPKPPLPCNSAIAAVGITMQRVADSGNGDVRREERGCATRKKCATVALLAIEARDLLNARCSPASASQLHSWSLAAGASSAWLGGQNPCCFWACWGAFGSSLGAKGIEGCSSRAGSLCRAVAPPGGWQYRLGGIVAAVPALRQSQALFNQQQTGNCQACQVLCCRAC